MNTTILPQETHDKSQDKATGLNLFGVFAAMGTALILLYFSGFAEAAQYHDAAHDTRHTLAFPCH